MNQLPDRVPPSNPQLEVAMLGGIMTEPKAAFPLAAQYVSDRPEDESFYLDGHRIIFGVMRELHDRGVPPDSMAVMDELRARGLLERVGGSGYIGSMLMAVPTAANVEHHARLLKEKAQERKLIRGCTMIVDEAFKQEMTTDALYGLAQSTIYQLADEAVGPAQVCDLGTGIADHMTTALDRMDRAEPLVVTYPTGFNKLTQVTGGNRPGDLKVLAARPNVGKTRVEIYELCSIALTGVRVGFMSLDMGSDRFLQYAAGTVHNLRVPERPVDMSDLLRPRGDTMGRARLEEVKASGMWFRDMLDYTVSAGATLQQIEAMVRKMAARGCKVIAIDQSECIEEFNAALRPGHNRDEINAMLQRIQQLAGEYGVCIHLLHQINREGKDRPSLSDLAQSDAFARRPDVVVLLHDEQTFFCEHRDHRGYQLMPNGRACKVGTQGAYATVHTAVFDCRPLELIVAKNRGPKDTVVVDFDYRHGVLGNGEPAYQRPARTEAVKDELDELVDMLAARPAAEDLDSRSAKERTAEVLGGAA